MTDRNLSPQEMFVRLAAEHVPTYHFAALECPDFEAWKAEAYREVLATLGDWPDRVPLNPELLVEWEQDGLRKQRWVIDVSPHISATFLVNIPGDLAEGERRPAILCCHGHGPFGKEPVMGNTSSPELQAAIRMHQYDYGRQMAQAGYVTYAIDWIGFGERNDSNKPHFLNSNHGRDWCNVYYLHATMLGMTSLSINVTHGMAATDFAQTLPCVEPDRLGVMGLSGGGTMTLWMALCDERFRATEIICYSDLWARFGINDVNYCGMQVAPGLYKLVDLPDLQGLLAPRPLLVDIGVHDTCFRVDNAMACYRQVEAIYAAAGASDRLSLDLHPGEHGWGGNKSQEFFGEYL
ncbi:MAG: prolyl oligopeptidase family serine peptidase [Chloroflexi bacterium]|nr:prolyl oligopeptidase family serine peptidase [Chloroflexota bacterium]